MMKETEQKVDMGLGKMSCSFVLLTEENGWEPSDRMYINVYGRNEDEVDDNFDKYVRKYTEKGADVDDIQFYEMAQADEDDVWELEHWGENGVVEEF